MPFSILPASRGALSLLARLAFALLLVLQAPAASAQDGPPPEVRRAIDATVAMLGSSGDAALESYIDSAMDPASVLDRNAEVVRLRAVRTEVAPYLGRVAVEGEDDGVRIELSNAAGSRAVRLSLSPAGVTAIALTAPGGGEAAAGPPPDGATRDEAARAHIRAIERAGMWDDTARAAFVRDHLSRTLVSNMAGGQLDALLDQLAVVTRDAGGVAADDDGTTVTLTLTGNGESKIRFTQDAAAPFRIATLSVEQGKAPAPLPGITRSNLTQVLDDLDARGFNGVVSVKIGGEMLYRRAFGEANETLGIPMRLDTIFGTGSAPIDYTVAGILKLQQQGKLSLDDPIGKYLADVPADKTAMTLGDLLEDRSGLPDFLDRPGDWDLDLAWISRDEAVRRILASPLAFAPGTREEHSHAGYGLLAAIIEIVSGEDYYAFMKREFFDPAGMMRTGMYGDAGGFALADFAEGGGPSHVGLPNIPPNWGPTSWLVLGSGGMYSTLEDTERFRAYVTTGGGLPPQDAARFLEGGASLDGSDRGFEMFRSYVGSDTLITVIMTNQDLDGYFHRLFRALDAFKTREVG